MNQELITFKPVKKNIIVDAKIRELILEQRNQSNNNTIALCKAFIMASDVLCNQYPDYVILFKDLRVRSLVRDFDKSFVSHYRGMKLIEYEIEGWDVYMNGLVEWVLENSGDSGGYDEILNALGGKKDK